MIIYSSTSRRARTPRAGLFLSSRARVVGIVLAATMCVGPAGVAVAGESSRETIVDRVRVLSDPAMEGRGPGTEGLDRAAELIAAWFRDAGLQPAGEGGFFQEFGAEPSAASTGVVLPEGVSWNGIRLRNVVGKLPGSGSGWVIIGAHYDHLGATTDGALFPGADDNASGVVALCAVAEELAAEPTRPRGVLFVAFSGEEEGLLGSRHFVQHPPVPLSEVIAMLNLDTVGRMEANKLYVFAASSASEFPEVLRGVNLGFGLDLQVPPKGPFGSDHVAFLEKGMPALHFFTGPNLDYHRPTDTAEKVNHEGIATIASFAAETARYLADRERLLTFVPPGADQVKPPQDGAQAKPRRVSLGTIPDMGYAGGDGVPVTGVMPGSPAEKAGIVAGDKIVAIDGEKITSLEDYSGALKGHAPGDEIRVTLRRGAEEITLPAKLVERR